MIVVSFWNQQSTMAKTFDRVLRPLCDCIMVSSFAPDIVVHAREDGLHEFDLVLVDSLPILDSAERK